MTHWVFAPPVSNTPRTCAPTRPTYAGKSGKAKRLSVGKLNFLTTSAHLHVRPMGAYAKMTNGNRIDRRPASSNGSWHDGPGAVVRRPRATLGHVGVEQHVPAALGGEQELVLVVPALRPLARVARVDD